MEDHPPGGENSTSGSGERDIVHLSFSFIDDDPRIARQIAAQREAGYRVAAIGYGLGLNHVPMTAAEKLKRAVFQIPAWLAPSPIVTSMQRRGPASRTARRHLEAFRPRQIHIHNPELLPAAVAYARQAEAKGGERPKLVYDSHEFAQSERAERLAWRLVFPAYIRALERECLPEIDAVTCVSPTLSRLLRKSYGLDVAPIVLRNIPMYQSVPFRAVRDDFVLLHYHGILNSGRRLDDLVSLLAHLPERFRLRITGPVNQPGYDAYLIGLARKLGVAERLTIEAPIPHADLITHAADADIGIFLNFNSGPQQASALPNKIFEYAMAGLMIVAGPSSDLNDFVETHDCGLVGGDGSIAELAQRIGSLSAEDIDQYKHAALAAATRCNWDQEKRILLELTSRLI